MEPENDAFQKGSLRNFVKRCVGGYNWTNTDVSYLCQLCLTVSSKVKYLGSIPPQDASNQIKVCILCVFPNTKKKVGRHPWWWRGIRILGGGTVDTKELGNLHGILFGSMAPLTLLTSTLSYRNWWLMVLYIMVFWWFFDRYPYQSPNLRTVSWNLNAKFFVSVIFQKPNHQLRIWGLMPLGPFIQ